MPLEILHHVPRWVFVLFVVLLVLGTRQLLTRRVKFTRATIPSIVLALWSLYGATAAFASNPLALLFWSAGAVAAFALVFNRPLPAGTAFDTWQSRFTLPGSAVPLALMMGIFFTKFGVGVVLGLQPALASDSSFALTVCAVYGAFSGIFTARSARLLRLALQAQRLGTSTVSA